MKFLQNLLDWVSLKNQPAEVLHVQFSELQRQIPLLYALLIVNACAVSYTHYGVAPDYLTIWTLLPLVGICLARLVVWKFRKTAVPDADEIRKQLRKTMVLAAVIGVGYIGWALELSGFGGELERGHVATFVAITVIGCIFCLTAFPQAAFAVMLIVTIPYTLFFASLNEPVYMAIAVNIFLVSLVLMKVLINENSTFVTSVLTQKELETLSNENAQLARTDALTGLLNRRGFFSDLKQAIAQAEASNSEFIVGIMDLDGFKAINDTYGHHVGDQLLIKVGTRLAEITSVDDRIRVCRLGGDEFGLIMQASRDEAEKLGHHICTALSEPYTVENTSLSVGCSCGFAIYPEAGRSTSSLFDRSDYALYYSKRQCRGQVTIYSAAHEKSVRSERAIESALQTADFDAEFEVYLQPVFDLVRGSVCSFEALARWVSPSLGPVRPDQFIPIAERYGLINRLTISLFAKSLAALERMPAHINMGFNLSAYDITNKQTILRLLTILGNSPISANRLVFEITETAVMRSYDEACASMNTLRATGARLALDDFGIGYSNLSYLHRLPVDRIKIDRSFVLGMENKSDMGLVSSIITLCQSMDLVCVVEGVETEFQCQRLRELGCRYIQGYLIGRPIAATEAPGWLASEGSRPDMTVYETREMARA